MKFTSKFLFITTFYTVEDEVVVFVLFVVVVFVVEFFVEFVVEFEVELVVELPVVEFEVVFVV